MEKIGVFEKGRRIYQMEYLSKVFQLECPVFVRSSISSETGVLLSSVKLPYRRYPSHVYLFALLLTFIGLSMRTAAGRIRILFGISKFSHSTISRDTDRMNTEINRLSTWQPEESETGHQPQNDLPQPHLGALQQAIRGTSVGSPGPGRPATCVQPKYWRKPRPGLCECLFRLLTPMLQAPEYGNRILYAFLTRFECLLL